MGGNRSIMLLLARHRQVELILWPNIGGTALADINVFGADDHIAIVVGNFDAHGVLIIGATEVLMAGL